MIKIEWQKFIRARMWFGMYWAPNGGGNPDDWHDPHGDSPEIPGWVTSKNWWDWYIPMQKR